MDVGQDNDDKAADGDSLIEELSEDDDVQFILFGFQVVLANNWFLGGSLYAYKTKASDARVTPSSHGHVFVRQSDHSSSNHYANKRKEEPKAKNSRYTLQKRSSC